jgi:hypothetical protein
MRSFAQILLAPAMRAIALGLAFALATASAGATDPAAFSYWISMRGITEDAQPSYVLAAWASGGLFTTAFTGCAGHTYYLMAQDAPSVQAARSAGDTVQVHRGPQGSTQPATAAVICLVQVDQ